MVDEDGIPTDIKVRERNDAERLIESFMLSANETIAEHFSKLEVPFIYRVHENPKAERLNQFFEFISNFGLAVKGSSEDIHPATLQKIVEEVAGQKEEMVISTLMLRSMQQARYSEDNLGHFGLSADYYTHFTSPIRRYPDLIVHRLIRKYLIEKSMNSKQIRHWEEMLPDIADHTSKRERRAIDAERDTDDLKKSEYMIQHVGEVFTGIISSVANFGMFVELENTIEGMVHISNLTDDYYNFDERNMAIIGERQAKVFRIGDKVEVKVINVNVDERMIDFQIVGMPIAEKNRERLAREKTIKAKKRGTAKEQDKPNKHKKVELKVNKAAIKVNKVRKIKALLQSKSCEKQSKTKEKIESR